MSISNMSAKYIFYPMVAPGPRVASPSEGLTPQIANAAPQKARLRVAGVAELMSSLTGASQSITAALVSLSQRRFANSGCGERPGTRLSTYHGCAGQPITPQGLLNQAMLSCQAQRGTLSL